MKKITPSDLKVRYVRETQGVEAAKRLFSGLNNKGDQVTIQELKDQGFKVKFRHKRRWMREYPIDAPKSFEKTIGEFVYEKPELERLQVAYKLQPKGGMTVCDIERDGEVVVRGVALCNDVDYYNRTTGRNKSFGRAVRELQQQT